MKRLTVYLWAATIALVLVAAVSLLALSTAAAAQPAETGEKTALIFMMARGLADGETATMTPPGGVAVSAFAQIRVVSLNKGTAACDSLLIQYSMSEGDTVTTLLAEHRPSSTSSYGDTEIIDLPGRSLTITATAPVGCTSGYNRAEVWVYGR